MLVAVWDLIVNKPKNKNSMVNVFSFDECFNIVIKCKLGFIIFLISFIFYYNFVMGIDKVLFMSVL
jgi:hypothetical protein